MNMFSKSFVSVRLIKCCRSYNSPIHKLLKQKMVKKRFADEILGYHMLNYTPIKESVWEDINASIVSSCCVVSDQAMGNHLSGIDNKFNDWRISNKTAKIAKNHAVNVSSYRLTSVCNNRDIGDIERIVDEIQRRNDSFDYYSILLRKESLDHLTYRWYVIPKDFYVFDANLFDWDIKIGQKGFIVGWKSKFMDITFSMSSQLWYKFQLIDIEQFIIVDVSVYKKSVLMTYADVFHLKTKDN
jgi:hypothetical protein